MKHPLQLLAICPFAAALAHGQTVTATLLGVVQDESGAVVADAKIQLQNTATQEIRTTQSGSDGGYNFSLIRPGRYSLTVEKSGFKRAAFDEFTLQVDQTARIDVKLEVGRVTETLSVTAAPPLVASETSSIGHVVEQGQIQDLPLNGRSFYSLVLLAPGTTPTMPSSFIANNHPIPGQLTVPAFYVAGAREKSNGYLVDGVDSQDPHFQTPSLFPSVDAIQEFKLQTNSYSAEYGRFAAQVNVATRSGANEFHGSAYHFLRNDALDAANFFSNLTGQGKAPLRYNQFGATFGGPLSIPGVYRGANRTFFFASWESTRIRRGSTGQASVPTPDQRNGDFSRLNERGNRAIFDPATTRTVGGVIVRDPFAGNTIPGSRVVAFARGIIPYYPLPTFNVATGNNYATLIRDVSDADQFMGRVDHRFSDSDSLFFRYSIMDGNLTNNSAIPANGNATVSTTNNLAMNYVHVFNANTLYEFRAGYNRPVYFITQNGAFGENVTANLGIRNLVDVPVGYGVPTVTVTGMSALDAGTFNPTAQVTNTYQLYQSVSLTRGTHTIKAGVDARRLDYKDQTERQNRGAFGFTGGLTADPVRTTTTGVAFGDFLLGLPLTANGSATSLTGHFRGYNYGFFVQDDWKATRRLTLNLGLRYDYSTRLAENLNHLTAFDRNFPGGRLLLAGTSRAYLPNGTLADGPATPRGLVPNDTNNWGPRIGFAYRPFGDNRTAIRAGYGVFFDMIELQDLRTWTRNPPFGVILGLQGDQNANSNSGSALRIGELFPAVGSAAARTDIYSPGDRYPDPYYQQWNFNVQHALPSNLLIEVGYLGSKGTKLARRLNANQATLDADPSRPTALLSRRPYPLFGNLIRLTDNSANSVYHGFISRVEKRFSDGLSFLFSYTYSKALDSGSLIDNQPRDIRNLQLDKGRAAFDIRQRAVLSATWALPFGRGKRFAASGAMAAVAGGWQLNTIAAFRTGFPFSASANGDVCNCGASGQLAEQVGDPLSAFERTRLQWFNTAAFAQPARGLFGSSGRNILDAPGESTVDLSVFRNVPLAEPLRLQFRAEFFNLLNKTNFGVPNAQVGNPNYGIIQSASPSRAIQMALKLTF
jgi:outer membrane receptor protein involved in Fe transport